jgi:hypothetical protein
MRRLRFCLSLFCVPFFVTRQSRGAWLRQQGEMCLAPDRPWLRFKAEQWLPGDGTDFRWEAQVRMALLLRARVVDCFEGGTGKLIAKLLGLIPVVRSQGPATDRGEAIRGLAEVPWRPFAFRESRLLSWQTAVTGKLQGTFDDGRSRVTVAFEVDAEGRVLRAEASSRPRMIGRAVVETPWSGTFGEYRKFDRVRVPTVGEASWHRNEGQFIYWRVRVIDFQVLT